uniref:hypothetical protein n=1 Tax=Frankia tisae TaxID=2950104 RepID=UPI0021C165CB
VCNDVAEAVGVEVDPSGDADWAGIFELLAEIGVSAKANEAAVARVEALKVDLFLHGGFTIARWEAARKISAALEGEQQ